MPVMPVYQVVREDNQQYAFTAQAVANRDPLDYIGWDVDFAPATQEPWSRYENWKFTFAEGQGDSPDDFWLPLGIWRATANDNPNLNDNSKIELLLDGIPIAELTAPNQSVTFQTMSDNGGNSPHLTAQMSGMVSDLVNTEVSLYFEEEFITNGQLHRIRKMDEFLIVEYLNNWEAPRPGTLTATPKIYREGAVVATGDSLTLSIVEGDGGGGHFT